VSILIAAGTGVGLCLGLQPRAKVSMMIMMSVHRGIPEVIMAKRSLAGWVEPTCSCRHAGNVYALQIAINSFDNRVRLIRTGGVANVDEVLLAPIHCLPWTIANLVGLAIAARRHGGLGAASAGPSFASTIRQWVLVAQPVFNQRKRVELATALALAQLRQNLVGEHT
jgi:hypothetical protein